MRESGSDSGSPRMAAASPPTMRREPRPQCQERVREEEGYDQEYIDTGEIPEIIPRIVIGGSAGVDKEPEMEEGFPVIDFEADLKRRMREIDNGNF